MSHINQIFLNCNKMIFFEFFDLQLCVMYFVDLFLNTLVGLFIFSCAFFEVAVNIIFGFGFNVAVYG